MISFADNFQTDRITRGIERIHDHTNAAHKGKNDQHAREIQPDCPKTEAAIIYDFFFSERKWGEVEVERECSIWINQNLRKRKRDSVHV